MASGVFKSVMGISQLIAGAVQNKKAEKLAPSEVDPTQTSMLDTMRRLRKNYKSGSEAAVHRNTINNGLATVSNKATSFAGGNTGSLLSALGEAQSMASNAYNDMTANLEKNRLAALSLEDQQTDEIAQRKLDVRMMKYLQQKGQATSNLKAGQQNWSAGVEEFGAGADKFWGGSL